MELLLTLIIGGLAGWIASILLNRNEQMGILANVVVGILGAFVANYLLAPVFGVTAKLGAFSLGSFILTVLGAAIVLVIFNLLTRKRVR